MSTISDSGHNQIPESHVFKIVTVGDGTTGKTCFLMRFYMGTFPDEYIPTVCCNYMKDLHMTNVPERVCLQLVDTAGQEDYDTIRPLSYTDSDLVIFCFDITQRSSLVNIESKWIPEIDTHLPNVPRFLIGCKADLRSQTNDSKDKYISTSEGREMASRYNFYQYHECSAQTGDNVQEIFQRVAEVCLKVRNENKSVCCAIL